MSVSQRIKIALKLKRVSQEMLAEKLGVTQGAIGKQLNKDEEIDSLKFIDAVASLTGYPIDYFIKGEDNEVVNNTAEPYARYEPRTGEILEKLVTTLERQIKLLEKENIRLEEQLKQYVNK
jgi:transcriptional regulator with XRE-family HTH domain